MEEFSFSTKKMIIMAIIILIVIIAFYFITVLVLDKKKTKSSESTYTAIQYDEIIVGNMYKQNETEYYILATTKSDDKASSYMTNYQNYSKKEDSIKTYTIDLDSGFNKKYLSSESDFTKEYPTFKTSTLLKITDKQITDIYEGEEINTFLESLIN